jgi:hypothetical protein
MKPSEWIRERFDLKTEEARTKLSPPDPDLASGWRTMRAIIEYLDEHDPEVDPLAKDPAYLEACNDRDAYRAELERIAEILEMPGAPSLASDVAPACRAMVSLGDDSRRALRACCVDVLGPDSLGYDWTPRERAERIRAEMERLRVIDADRILRVADAEGKADRAAERERRCGLEVWNAQKERDMARASKDHLEEQLRFASSEAHSAMAELVQMRNAIKEAGMTSDYGVGAPAIRILIEERDKAWRDNEALNLEVNRLCKLKGPFDAATFSQRTVESVDGVDTGPDVILTVTLGEGFPVSPNEVSRAFGQLVGKMLAPQRSIRLQTTVDPWPLPLTAGQEKIS